MPTPLRSGSDAPRPSATRIEAAARALDPVFRDTPQFEHPALNAQLACRVVCKIETLNPIGSFKGRGTDELLRRRAPASGGLVCASAGNFGQGMARAAQARGVPLTVFAATGANAVKVERMRAWGAEVRLHGDDLDDAKEAALAHAADQKLSFIEDGREVEVTEGAGTIGVELTRASEPLDAVLVPLGNGALANGIGTWLRSARPETRLVGVAAEGAPAMERSWRAGRPIATERVQTIADGIAVRQPVPEAVAVMLEVVDEVLLVPDETLLRAMRDAFRVLGVVLEPAGAAGLAALLEYGARFHGLRVAVPLCGNLLTDEQRARWLAS